MTQILCARSIAIYVNAIEMTRQEYCDIRCWTLPGNENGDDAGYLIEDPAGEKNTSDYDGYVTWMTKAEFKRKFTFDEDACCEAEPDMKCADSTMGTNAVSSISHHVRDDILLLTQVLSCRNGMHVLEETASRKLEMLINQAFPEADKKDKAAEQPSTPKERVEEEQAQLAVKLAALGALLEQERPEFIDADHWDLLEDQFVHMKKYNAILLKRLEKF